MKKIKLIAFSIALISLLSIIVISCDSNNGDNAVKTDQNSMRAILAEVSKLAETKKKLVTFDVHIEDGKFVMTNLKVMENVKYINDSTPFKDGKNNTLHRSHYIITCSNGGPAVQCDKKDTTCVQNAIAACSDAGGCTQICKTSIMYIPENIN
ncbi:hypothetical protein [Flavobacterium sp. '19STA2R22 D10 B1']|uniref:hypothetical protein n=1 Tax=Flavobacterium aerium TaxID=3037261 RepID=UPI00278C7BE8|nr:hypothetical protein [Flavobacterium sp. '19STA2R22 D10 B1']